MRNTRISRVYAHALFNAASKLKDVQRVEDDLNLVNQSLKSSKEFTYVFCSPIIPAEQKLTLVKSVFKEHIAKLTLDLIQLLLEKHREDFFNDILHEYERLRRESLNVTYYIVTSAKPLDEGERKSLLQRIHEVTGKQVEAQFKVEKDLIGGLTVARDNVVYDGTIKDGLRRLRETLSQDLFQHIK